MPKRDEPRPPYSTPTEIEYIEKLNIEDLKVYIESLRPGVRNWDPDVDQAFCLSWAEVLLEMHKTRQTSDSTLAQREVLRQWLDKERGRWTAAQNLYKRFCKLNDLVDLQGHPVARRRETAGNFSPPLSSSNSKTPC